MYLSLISCYLVNFLIVSLEAINYSDFRSKQDLALEEAPREVHEAAKLSEDFRILNEIVGIKRSETRQTLGSEMSDLQVDLSIASSIIKDKYKKAHEDLLDKNWFFKRIFGRRQMRSLEEEISVESLKLFGSISGSLKPFSCDYETYLILAKNYKAALSRANSEINLVSNDVFEAMHRHNIACKGSYQVTFYDNHTKQSIGSSWTTMEHIIDDHTIAEIFEGNKPLRVIQATNLHEKLVRFGPELARKLANTSDGSANKSTISKLFESNLVKPCQDLLVKFKQIFVPARFDVIFDQSETLVFEVFGERVEGFLEYWFRFRACREIVNDPIPILIAIEGAHSSSG